MAYLGLTGGEFFVVAFVFVVVVAAPWVPKLGAQLGGWLSRGGQQTPREKQR